MNVRLSERSLTEEMLSNEIRNWRRGDGDSARPAGALDPRSSQHPRGDHRQRAGFRPLADAWTDTTTALGRSILTVLGGLAEFERGLSRQPPTARVRPPARDRDSRRTPPWNQEEKTDDEHLNSEKSPLSRYGLFAFRTVHNACKDKVSAGLVPLVEPKILGC
jgi:hypothetical protein